MKLQAIVTLAILGLVIGFQNCSGVGFSSAPTSAASTGGTGPTGCGIDGCGPTPTPGPSNTPTPGPSSTPTPKPQPTCTPTVDDAPIDKTLPPDVSQATLQSVCPAVGLDTVCGALIIIRDGATGPGSFSEEIYFTGQRPYDGSDDTLVGVLNLSSSNLNSLNLKSPNDIMGFDGDGVDLAKYLGLPVITGSYGYGGPDTTFNNMPTGCPTNNLGGVCDSGTANFTHPIPPQQSTYFGLENALSPQSACLIVGAH